MRTDAHVLWPPMQNFPQPWPAICLSSAVTRSASPHPSYKHPRSASALIRECERLLRDKAALKAQLRLAGRLILGRFVYGMAQA